MSPFMISINQSIFNMVTTLPNGIVMLWSGTVEASSWAHWNPISVLGLIALKKIWHRSLMHSPPGYRSACRPAGLSFYDESKFYHLRDSSGSLEKMPWYQLICCHHLARTYRPTVYSCMFFYHSSTVFFCFTKIFSILWVNLWLLLSISWTVDKDGNCATAGWVRPILKVQVKICFHSKIIRCFC